jgi:RimJ/RimL family protein N-acetyltransferase
MASDDCSGASEIRSADPLRPRRTGVPRAAGSEHWPLFDLRVRAAAVELRYPDDCDTYRLADLVDQAPHQEGCQPFATAWTALPAPHRQRSLLQTLWRARAGWHPDAWLLPMAIVAGGEVVGMQAMLARNFNTLGLVRTESWVGARWQRRGYGTAARQAILSLAFDGLLASDAESVVWADNAASLTIARRLGYESNGTYVGVCDGHSRPGCRLSLSRQRWEAVPRAEVRIHGLSEAADFFSGDGAAWSRHFREGYLRGLP